MPVLALTNQRLGHNYDLYEFSTVPPTLPSGGGFSIKNFSLNTLYSEHNYCRNKWTKSNLDYPLVRYTGCQFKFYQADLIDYIVTYDTSLPLRSNLEMYQTMQPNIHMMLQNRILIPSKITRPNKRKPYVKLNIKPPTQLMNKWYFQADFAKTPLVQIRSTATTLGQYWQSHDSENNNITITFLSTTIQNRNILKYPAGGYSNRKQVEETSTADIYLYSTLEEPPGGTLKIPLKKLIFLGQTKSPQLGDPIENMNEQTYTEKHWGNPFYSEYLKNSYTVLQSKITLSTLLTKIQAGKITLDDIKTEYQFNEVQLTDAIRYNPMKDWGKDNKVYILPLFKDGQGWDPPTDDLYSQTISEGLPLWLILHGYQDFMYRAHSFARYYTDYIIVVQTRYDNNKLRNLVLVSNSLIEGYSPHEEQINPEDRDRWHPCIQFQEEMINTIIQCGPGTPKLRDDTTAQCNMQYKFFFKWGGNLPPMSSIQDPIHQPTYPVPNNYQQTIPLQNPETNPEHILYSFDERRGQLTTRAIKRILQDTTIKTPFITDAESGHIPPVQTTCPQTQEESSEEEETTQTLLNKLYQQRIQQHRLKQLILQKMNLQNIE
uniref:Capsid protein n=1 Tax=Anelloviridae sp. ctgwM5 TaxID=2828022 RepID=A0A8S5RX26_9VIRU|nr:MAG TPA: TT viral orf 1 [Anelloviridae sp. ctgwM5]